MGVCGIPVLGDPAVQGDDVANLDLVANGAAEDEQTLAGGRILIRLRRAQEDAIGANGSDKTLDALDVLSVVRRQELVAVDLGDGDGRGNGGGGQEGGDGLHGERGP